jgi:hypothetical protein
MLCQLSLEETMQHLFLECPFAKSCWNMFNITFSQDSGFPEALLQIRAQVHSHFFMILTILMCWAFWTARNDLILKCVQAYTVKEFFYRELKLLTTRAKSKDASTFDLWIQNWLLFLLFFLFS